MGRPMEKSSQQGRQVEARQAGATQPPCFLPLDSGSHSVVTLSVHVAQASREHVASRAPPDSRTLPPLGSAANTPPPAGLRPMPGPAAPASVSPGPPSPASFPPPISHPSLLPTPFLPTLLPDTQG